MKYDVSIVITTRDRITELRRALLSVRTQTDIAIELIVGDDGCTDGTAEMVRSEFPEARFIPSNESLGVIRRRNLTYKYASADIILTIDDDAEFVSPHTTAQTLRELDDLRIAAVAMPYINVNQGNLVRTIAPDQSEIWLAPSFTGTAVAFRKAQFNQVGGFREFYYRQGEERDLCVRLLAAGYLTRLGSADPLHHHESPRRNRKLIVEHTARNTILFTWWYIPAALLLPNFAMNVFNLLRFGLKIRHPIWVTQGIFRGFIDIFRSRSMRQPISYRVYRLFRLLQSKPATRLSEAAPLLNDK